MLMSCDGGVQFESTWVPQLTCWEPDKSESDTLSLLSICSVPLTTLIEVCDLMSH